MTDSRLTEARTEERILVVDDDESTRMLLNLVLGHEGYAVCEARDGIEALTVFQQQTPDLVLLDLLMPGEDGFAACERLHALPNGPLTPIIVITALTDHTSLRRAFEAGAVDYLTKPIDIVALKLRVRRSLQMRAAEKAVYRAEAKYRGIFENSSEGLFQSSLDGHILNANPAMARILGYDTPAELKDRITDAAAQLYVRPTDRQFFTSAIETHGEIYAFETEFYCQDGSQVWISLNARRAVDEQGQVYYEGAIEDVTARKQAELALRTSEEKYRQLVGTIEGIVWESDAHTFQLTYVSPQAERILGYPIACWLTEPDFWANHLHPDDHDWCVRFCREAVGEGQGHSLEYRMITSVGSVIWLHDAIKLVKDAEGRPTMRRGIMFDVTARKQVEENLERVRRQMDLILNSAGEGIFGLDRQGRITFSNLATAQMVGRTQEEMLGRHQHELIHHSYADGTLYPVETCPIHAAFRDGAVHRVSGEVFWRKDNTSFPVEYVSTPIRENDQILGAVVVFRDITERLLAQRALEESEQQFRQVMEIVQVIGVVLDGDGRILFSNEYLSQLTGWSREELLNRNFFDAFTPPEYHTRQGQTLAEYSARDALPEPINFESEMLSRDGTQRLIAWKVAFMHDLRDRALRWMVLGEDITERRKAELQAIQADRLAALGRLAAALAHEINNPLQAIQSHLELVLDFPVAEEERVEFLKVVRQQIGRLNDITRSVLNFAKPSPAPRSLISIDELIEQTLKLAGKQLEHSHIRVTKELTAACYLLAAPAQLVQVFLNLTINAIEAIHNNGHMHISSRCNDDQAIITFANDGPAIAPQDLPHIFEPFYTTKMEGTGLGLSVSHSLVRQHGGQLKVENIAPDRGVVFTISLPLIPMVEPEHAA